MTTIQRLNAGLSPSARATPGTARSCAGARGRSTAFVTHDQEEAMELADLVVVMSMGRIEQGGKPAEIGARPATDFVHDFTAA
ncbi:hypothetical protein EV655_11577 [Rhodovulum euryhalinum]|uniref:Uncharacterized protein n=1 Tax=Rhodovulum euryhalinum TaxID=35805 RepID=A0A4R2K9M7_9RHOB|nr:hypothetical protein EV655_11577 [Rhodovulum euryhalinum]